MREVFDKTIDFLRLIIPDFKCDSRGSVKMFTCPVCLHTSPTCHIIPGTNDLFCTNCDISHGNVLDIVRIDEEKIEWTEDQALKFIADKLGIECVTKSDIENTFKYYKSQGFDMVPIQANGKIPIEKEWPTKNHKSEQEWYNWLDDGLNIGAKQGKISNSICLDIDRNTIPKAIWEHVKDYKGFQQRTSKGHHFFYKYDPEIGNSRFEIEGTHIDIQSDGTQVVIFPSKVDGSLRLIEGNLKELPEMPKGLKELILPKATILQPLDDESNIKKNIDVNNIKFSFISEGNRTNSLMTFGGILRKDLSLKDVSSVLGLINRSCLNPPLSDREFQNCISSLDKYSSFDHKDLSLRVIDYFKIVNEATSNMVQKALEEKKYIIDKTLNYLVKEGFLIKKDRGVFKFIRKAQWRDTFDELDNPFPYKMPYFFDQAYFSWGDLIILGAQTKIGKTTICMNMIRDFVSQGIKPYYISLEAGSRFRKTWNRLGGIEGQFYWTKQFDSNSIELENNAITILDWLQIENKAETDTVIKYFSNQLEKTKGVLIIFMQLKDDNGWFAPNLVKQFPALAGRYIYDSSDDGEYGSWHLDAIREPKTFTKKARVPCRYIHDTRELIRIE